MSIESEAYEWFKTNLPLWSHNDVERTLSADNIVLYFRTEYKEWRLKDETQTNGFDIVNISPFIEHDITIIKQKASAFHKS